MLVFDSYFFFCRGKYCDPGAGAIFGVTGGVMEAALRTAIVVTSKESETPKRLEFHEVRGLHGMTYYCTVCPTQDDEDDLLYSLKCEV
eukprot:m.133496 g.133496  ORF g.133496 m.133496 type:complete len:88 (+) comp13944_c5_seq1:2035-2298(+)